MVTLIGVSEGTRWKKCKVKLSLSPNYKHHSLQQRGLGCMSTGSFISFWLKQMCSHIHSEQNTVNGTELSSSWFSEEQIEQNKSEEFLWEGEGSWETVRNLSVTTPTLAERERWTGGTQHQNATTLSSCHYIRTLPHNNVVLPGFKACITIKLCNYVEMKSVFLLFYVNMMLSKHQYSSVHWYYSTDTLKNIKIVFESFVQSWQLHRTSNGYTVILLCSVYHSVQWAIQLNTVCTHCVSTSLTSTLVVPVTAVQFNISGLTGILYSEHILSLHNTQEHTEHMSTLKSHIQSLGDNLILQGI